MHSYLLLPTLYVYVPNHLENMHFYSAVIQLRMYVAV